MEYVKDVPQTYWPGYVLVCTSMYQYIVAYQRIYWYILIYTSVPVHKSMYHYILDYDFAIQRIYKYVRVQTVPNRFKKGANMF